MENSQLLPRIRKCPDKQKKHKKSRAENNYPGFPLNYKVWFWVLLKSFVAKTNHFVATKFFKFGILCRTRQDFSCFCILVFRYKNKSALHIFLFLNKLVWTAWSLYHNLTIYKLCPEFSTTKKYSPNSVFVCHVSFRPASSLVCCL